jgi:hypothetical protein
MKTTHQTSCVSNGPWNAGADEDELKEIRSVQFRLPTQMDRLPSPTQLVSDVVLHPSPFWERAMGTICWEHGQFTAQPIFGRSDERFTGCDTIYSGDTIYSASIASDRAGNERAVNVCKRSGVIQGSSRGGCSNVPRHLDYMGIPS